MARKLSPGQRSAFTRLKNQIVKTELERDTWHFKYLRLLEGKKTEFEEALRRRILQLASSKLTDKQIARKLKVPIERLQIFAVRAVNIEHKEIREVNVEHKKTA